jgi:hypothetical protein
MQRHALPTCATLLGSERGRDLVRTGCMHSPGTPSPTPAPTLSPTPRCEQYAPVACAQSCTYTSGTTISYECPELVIHRRPRRRLLALCSPITSSPSTSAPTTPSPTLAPTSAPPTGYSTILVAVSTLTHRCTHTRTRAYAYARARVCVTLSVCTLVCGGLPDVTQGYAMALGGTPGIVSS